MRSEVTERHAVFAAALPPAAPERWRNLSITRDRRGRLNNTGSDVDKLRVAVNREIKRLGLDDFGYKPIPERGPVDITLLRRARGVAGELGAPDAQLEGPLRPWLQILVRARWRIYAKDDDTARRARARMQHRKTKRREMGGSPQAIAARILRNPRIDFYPNSTGNDRQRLVEIVNKGVVYVPATGEWIKPKVDLLLLIQDFGDHTSTLITALTGGVHMLPDDIEPHYHFNAVDVSIFRGSTRTRESIAPHHGFHRNFEANHEHYGHGFNF